MSSEPEKKAATILLVIGVFIIAAVAQAKASTTSERVSVTVPDVVLTDQNGKAIRLREDVIGDNTVAVNFVYTGCNVVCTPLGAAFGQLQQELGDRPDVKLVSITLDPEADTPARLKEFARKFSKKGGAQWTLLTGSPDRVKQALKALGGYVSMKEAHSPMFLLGDGSSGKWERVYGLPGARALAGRLEELRR